ncbi:MAG: hypothetical protein AAB386_03665 [Patescibacteria group bacterium]
MSFEGTMNVPMIHASLVDSNSSGQPDEEDGLKVLKRAAEFDKARTLDWALRSMVLQGSVTQDAITLLACHVTLEKFLYAQTGFWTYEAKARLNAAIRMCDGVWQPAYFREEVWRLFRLRIRREGALTRIVRGNIIYSKAAGKRVAA